MLEDLQQLSMADDATTLMSSALHVRTRLMTLNELTPALREHRTRKQNLLREEHSPDIGDRYTEAVSGLAMLMSCSIGNKPPTHHSQNMREETKSFKDSEGPVNESGNSDKSPQVSDSFSRRQEQLMSLHRAQMALYMTYFQQMIYSKLLPSNCAGYSTAPQTPVKAAPRPETPQTTLDQRSPITKRGAMHILIAQFIVNDRARATYPAVTGPIKRAKTEQSLLN
jgi:hypothetical protein